MKKNLLSAMVVLLRVVTLIGTIYVGKATMTDEEKLVMYRLAEFSEDYQGYNSDDISVEIIDPEAENGDGIDYFVYVNGELKSINYTNRSYMDRQIQ